MCYGAFDQVIQGVAVDKKNARAGVLMRQMTGLYQRLLLTLFTLMPMMAIAYIDVFQEPSLRFESHMVHEMAIALAITLSAFITYVSWRCYTVSGEVLVRWLALGFLGFTLIYLPHGLLTRLAPEDQGLFLVYGPVSRLAMAFCFLAGLYYHAAPADVPESCQRLSPWIKAGAGFLVVDLALAGVYFLSATQVKFLLTMVEIVALILLLAGVLFMAVRRFHLPLMVIYMISLGVLSQSSIAFLLSDIWSHQWWLAHGISAAGFFILSFGVVQAFRTTRSFSTVYSQAQVMEQLRVQQARTLDALAQLETANTQLARQAATDWLTGTANRRQHMTRAKEDIARASLDNGNLSVLCLDIDHFKQVNDSHGHDVGDEVLKGMCIEIQRNLRTQDLLSRVGGEEFQVLLPETDLGQAARIAERIRIAVAALRFQAEDTTVGITLSIGCAQLGSDGNDMDALTRKGDKRLYLAKERGRDQVASEDTPVALSN